MNFTVSQASLQTALDIVMKGIGSNPSLPILSGVYLKAQEGTLELQSNDLTISIKHKVAANVEEEGETVVSAKVLQTIVKKAYLSKVNISPHGSSCSRLAGIP